MTSISSVSSTSQPQTQAAAGATGLGKDDFLRLLVAQLQHQDPLAPTQDREFMAQMAQFSALEQMSNVAVSMERLTQTSEMGIGASLFGKTVSYREEADGPLLEGIADRVSVEDGVVVVHVGDRRVPLDAITSVAPGGSEA